MESDILDILNEALTQCPVTGSGRFVVVAFYVHFPSVCFGYSRSSSLVTRIKIDGNT